MTNNAVPQDLQFILDHFPDGVDVRIVDNEFVLESVFTLNGLESNEIILHELEPETDVYAGMSPITHRVYVFAGREAP
jgi:hypothetical protein